MCAGGVYVYWIQISYCSFESLYVQCFFQYVHIPHSMFTCTFSVHLHVFMVGLLKLCLYS